jgi:uncharacterized protein YlaI
MVDDMKTVYVCRECDVVLSHAKLYDHVVKTGHLWFKPITVP